MPGLHTVATVLVTTLELGLGLGLGTVRVLLGLGLRLGQLKVRTTPNLVAEVSSSRQSSFMSIPPG